MQKEKILQKTKKKSTYKPIVPALDQALKLLACLAENSRSNMTLTEICEQQHISKSKAYTLLNTLKQHDFIRKDDRTKTYSLWLGIVRMGRNVLENLDVRDLCSPYLATLVEQTHCTAHMGIVSGDRFYIIARSDVKGALGFTLRQFGHLHFTHGAHGKAIVAFMEEEEQSKVLAGETLCFYGDGEPVDIAYLKEELNLCKKRGYAQDPGETNHGLNAVAAPVFNARGRVYGAVVLLGTFPRSQIKSYGEKVTETAQQISVALGATL